jgi:hypothetical protein
MMHRTYIESLEQRQLLAGITILAPAWDGGLTGWLDHAEADITADLGGPQNVPNYTITLAPNSSGTLVVQGVTHVAGTATPQSNNPGQILLTVDYTSVSTNPNYPAAEVAGLVTNYMENDPVDGVTWASLPIHLISTSIGTAVTDAIAQSLDTSGIWVDQETYLDPNPDTSAPFFDPLNAVYDNVEFADDYYRLNPDDTNSNSNPQGHSIDGAYNQELTYVQADFSGFGIAHLAPPAYYDGTIDPSTVGGSDGDGPIHTDWYGNGSTPTTFPSASQTGFYYSAIDGGTRPASGLWAASGGTGDRTAVTHTGTQWPNVADLTAASTSAASNTTLGLSYIHEDQSQTDSITFSLDTDQNPFNGTGYGIGTQTGLASSTSISGGSFTGSLNGVPAGTYYLVAQVTGSTGLTRYDYSLGKVTITPPVVGLTSNAHSNPSTVTGTTTHLITAATDSLGDGLTYTWTFTHLPAGAHTPTISGNGRSTASKVGVTFYKQGGYRFTCTITATAGNSATTSGEVDVVETATRLEITPVKATVVKGHTRRLTTSVINQFGHTLGSDPAASYFLESGPAKISRVSGVFYAGSTAGTALIKVEDDGLVALVDEYVVN